MPANETIAWILFLLGMLTGAVLGIGFQREQFLGGYTSRRRRLLRLGHISFFGLGALNWFFAHSLPRAAAGLTSPWIIGAAWLMVIGGLSMPACCALNAWRARFQPLFALPVLSLLSAVSVLIVGFIRQ